MAFNYMWVSAYWLLLPFAFSCGSLRTILSFCKRLLTQEWKAVCSCCIKTNLDQEPNSLAFFYSLGTPTAPQLCFSKNSGKKKWKLSNNTFWLILNSWICLLCFLLGLSFTLQCFIFSLLTFTMEIGVSCFIITQGFHPCYYRYYNKYCPLQRSQASVLCPVDLQKNAQSSAQETQCSLLWLLLGFDPSSAEPCIGSLHQ